MVRQATQRPSHSLYTSHFYSCATGSTNQHTGVGTVTTQRRHRLPCARLQVPQEPHHKVPYHTLCAEVTLEDKHCSSVLQSWCHPTECSEWPKSHPSSTVIHKPRALCTAQPMRPDRCKRCTAQHTPHNSTGMLLVHNGKTYGKVGLGRPAHKSCSYPQQHGWPCLLSLQAAHMCFTQSEPGVSALWPHSNRTVRQSPVLQRWCHPPRCYE